MQDRTFVVTSTKEVSADGVLIKDSTRVACITSPISVQTLLGLIQFHGFAVEEIAQDEVSEDAVDESDDPVDPVDAVDSPEAEQTTDPAEADTELEPDPEPEASAVEKFVADGVDEKTAKALADGGLDPDAVRKLIAEGFDLTDLEGIGQTRADKLLAIYKMK